MDWKINLSCKINSFNLLIIRFGNIQQVMKSVEGSDLSRKKPNDGEDLGMIHLYQRYIMRRSPLGPPNQTYLSDKNPHSDMNTRNMRKQLRKEAFILYTETKQFKKRHRTMIKCTSPTALFHS
jgi:hypothetical protein